jgi:hypothetical protein
MLDDLTAAETDTLELAIENLKRLIDSPQRKDLAKQNLATCKQHVGESVQMFTERFIPLVNAAIPDPATRRERIVELFLEKISENIAFLVKLTGAHSSFESARAKAQELENMLNNKKSKEIPDIRAISTPQQLTSQSDHRPAAFPPGKFANWAPVGNYESQPEPKRVSFDPSTTHWAERVSQPSSSSWSDNRFARSRTPPLAPNRSYGGTKSGVECCYYCGKPGHRKNVCRAFIRDQRGTQPFFKGTMERGRIAYRRNDVQYPQSQRFDGPRQSSFREPKYQTRFEPPTYRPPPTEYNNQRSSESNRNQVFSMNNDQSFPSSSRTENSIEELITLLKGNMNVSSINPINGPTHSLNTLSIQQDNTSRIRNDEITEIDEIETEKPSKSSIQNWEKSQSCTAKKPVSLMSILSLSLMLMFMSSMSNAMRTAGPMICQTERQATLWRIPEVKCNFEPFKYDTVPTPLTIDLYSPNVAEFETEAHVCRKVKKKVRIYSTITGAPLAQPVEPENIPISVHDCVRMHERKACDQGILTNDSGLWHTGKELDIKWGWPIFDSFRTRHGDSVNCFAFDSMISTRFGMDEIQSALEGAEQCKYRDGNCTLSDGTVLFWTPSKSQTCRFTYRETLEGNYGDDRWIGDELALKFSNQSETEDCGKKLLVSEQGMAAIFSSKQSRFRRTLDGNVKASQLAAQLSYLDYDISHVLTTALNHLTSSLCKQLSEIRYWTLASLMSNPTTLVRNIFNNTLLVAKQLTPNVVSVWPCVPLESGTYYFKATGLDQCFKRLPIHFRTKSSEEFAFIEPTTLIVHPDSEVAPCAQTQKILVEIDGEMMKVDQKTGSSEILRMPKAFTLDNKDKWEIQGINPHAFHQNVLANLTDTATHAFVSNLVHTTRMTYRIQGLGEKLTVIGAADWESVKTEVLKSIFGDWTEYWRSAVTLICLVYLFDISFKVAALLAERYMGHGRLGRMIGLVLKRGQVAEQRETEDTDQATTPPHAPGNPLGWPPSVMHFPDTPRRPSSRFTINMISLHPDSKSFTPRWSSSSPTVIGHLNRVPCSMIIDTGASVSVVSTALGLLLPLPLKMEATDAVMFDLSGNKIFIDARARVSLRIGTVSRFCWIYFTSALSVNDDVILGIDSIRSFPPLYLDFDGQFMSFKGHKGIVKLIDGLCSVNRKEAVQYEPTWEPSEGECRIQTIHLREKEVFKSIIGAKLNGQLVKCLVDTGATVTVAPLSLAKERNWNMEPIDFKAVSASGHAIPIVGQVEAVFSVLEWSVTITIYIMDDTKFDHSMENDVILGCDSLARLPPITIDYQNGRVHLGADYDKRSFCQLAIRALRVCSIPPETQAIIPAYVKGLDRSATLLIQSLDSRLTAASIGTNPTVVEVSHDFTVPVILFNPTKAAVPIFKDMRIGSATELVDDNQCENSLRILTLRESNTEQSTSVEHKQEEDPSFKLDFSNSNLNGSDLERLRALCEEFQDVFSKNKYDLGSCSVGKHDIVTTTDKAVSVRPRRTPFKTRDFLKNHIKSLLDTGVMVESDTPWVSNFVLVQKKDGSLRPCIDFRKLNEVTVPDHYPLPRLDAILERIGNCAYYSSLDLSSGYHQIKLTEEASNKCGVITEDGVYQMTHLPFGLKNATAAFGRTMAHVLSGLDDVIAYVDDILVYTKNNDVTLHLDSLRKVFERFRLFMLKLSPKKCVFGSNKMTYLGFVIDENGYRPSLTKIEVIKDLPQPSSVKEIKRFIGIASFFRKHIRNFSTIAEPLTKLTRKEEEFEWKGEQQVAFDELKNILSSEPSLKFPDYSKAFHIFTDASGSGHGGALMQYNEDTKSYSAVSYCSRTLSSSERKWPPVQIELGAIIYALRTFRPYIYDSKVELHTDHKPLSYMLKKADAHPNLARWLIELQNYNINIVHIAGKQNSLADALSRIHEDDEIDTDEDELKDIAEYPTCLTISMPRMNIETITDVVYIRTLDGLNTVDIKQAQQEDAEIKEIMRYVERGGFEEMTREENDKYALLVQKLIPIDGIMYYKDDHKRARIFVPATLRPLVFDAFHNSKLGGGHMSLRKTMHKCCKYFWPKMHKDIVNLVKACMTCQLRNSPTPHYKAEMLSVPCNTLFARVGLDLAGPFPITEKGNKHILNIICWFTKYIVSVPIPDAKATTIANALLNHCFLKYGGCTELISDNATSFTSDFFKDFCSLLSVNKLNAIPHWSQGNAITERSFRTYHNILAKYMTPDCPNFDEFLNYATFAYNTSMHFTTNESPFFLMYGRDPIFTIDHILDGRVREPLFFSEESDFKHRLISSLQSAWEAASEETEKHRQKMKERYDRKARIPDIRAGDLVLLKNYIPQLSMSKKHQQHWRGTFRVLKVDGVYVTIKSVKTPQSNPFKVHINQVKRQFELQGPATTFGKLTADEKESLVESEAVELDNQPGHTHEIKTANQTPNVVTETNTTNTTEGTEHETGEKQTHTHTYNLRKNVNHSFIRARANT